MKFLWGLFKKYNGIDAFDIPVMELFSLCSADSFILTKQMVSRVAGTALAGKGVADLLDLNVCQAPVFQFHDDVRVQQRRF